MKKKKRQELYQRHIEKQKIEQQTSGKLIEENHNGLDYSPSFTRRAISWYLSLLWMKTKKYQGRDEDFLKVFRGIKQKLQTILLLWNPEVPRDWEWNFIKDLLDMYREGNDNLLNFCTEKYKNLGLL